MNRNPETSDAPVAEESPAENVAKLSLLEKLLLGLGNYYSALVQEKDEVLAVGAACALIDSNFVPPAMLPRLRELAVFQAVRTRAFDYFLRYFEYGLAKETMQAPARPTGDVIQEAMEATIINDLAALARIEVQKFKQSGVLEHLVQAANAAEAEGGWRRALPLLIKLVLIDPKNPRWPLRLCRSLTAANQFDLMAQFCGIIETAGMFPMIGLIYRAVLANNAGSPGEALKLLDRVKINPMPRYIELELATQRAAFLDAAGRFEEASQWYEKQNTLGRTPGFDRDRYIEGVKLRAALTVPELPRDGRDNYFMMLGFPRSGTTLLENALASHPAIETFEEIPGWTSVKQAVREAAHNAAPMTRDLAIMARENYYREIDRLRRKPGADILIDKLPILSAEAAFLEKLFPQKKYIFSIRHPYDVVLSCYKQMFIPNPAMDNFTTFADSCRAYDFAMNQWFEAFSLQSERVCYIRYDRLVENLQEEVTRVLHFTGTTWDDGILQFAQRAGERRLATPSYSQVRKGVSIGVQTSWRNYRFLLRKPEARLIDRWVGFFGYDGL